MKPIVDVAVSKANWFVADERTEKMTCTNTRFIQILNGQARRLKRRSLFFLRLKTTVHRVQVHFESNAKIFT